VFSRHFNKPLAARRQNRARVDASVIDMNRFVCALLMLGALVPVTAAVGGCGIKHAGDPLAPTSAAAGTSYVGTWRSNVASAPTGSTCGNFEWRVTNQSEGIISGVFTAQCGGSLTVSGSAWGQPNGTTIPITATAGGVGPGIPACDVSFTSTATADGATIRVPYSGKTCLGPMSGVEVLTRQ
jgi:hypothetical protein